MISFHPHGSLEHLPLCLSTPEPGGNKDQLLLRCPGHAAPEMNWKESSPSLSTPLPSVRLLLSPTPFPKFFLLSFPFTPLFNSSLVHLNQVFTKPIPCDRHTVRHSGYNSQQAWLQEPQTLAEETGTAFPSDPLSSSPPLLSLTVRFFSVLTVLHSLLHPEISAQPHRPARRRQHGLLAAQPSHLALSFARQVPNSVPHVLFLSLDSHTLSIFCNFLTTPKALLTPIVLNYLKREAKELPQCGSSTVYNFPPPQQLNWYMNHTAVREALILCTDVSNTGLMLFT